MLFLNYLLFSNHEGEESIFTSCGRGPRGFAPGVPAEGYLFHLGFLKYSIVRARVPRAPQVPLGPLGFVEILSPLRASQEPCASRGVCFVRFLAPGAPGGSPGITSGCRRSSWLARSRNSDRIDGDHWVSSTINVSACIGSSCSALTFEVGENDVTILSYVSNLDYSNLESRDPRFEDLQEIHYSNISSALIQCRRQDCIYGRPFNAAAIICCCIADVPSYSFDVIINLVKNVSAFYTRLLDSDYLILPIDFHHDIDVGSNSFLFGMFLTSDSGIKAIDVFDSCLSDRINIDKSGPLNVSRFDTLTCSCTCTRAKLEVRLHPISFTLDTVYYSFGVPSFSVFRAPSSWVGCWCGRWDLPGCCRLLHSFSASACCFCSVPTVCSCSMFVCCLCRFCSSLSCSPHISSRVCCLCFRPYCVCPFVCQSVCQ